MILGFETAAKLKAAQAEQLAALGYKYAIRYLVPNTGELGKKALTAEEAKALHQAGLHIGLCWETTAARAKDGAAAGLQDGQTAKNLALGMNVPASTVIYFAVDYAAPAADYDRISAYMIAAAAAVRPYRLGVYGSYYTIEEMHRWEIGAAYWQCVGWSGGKVSEHLNIYQKEWNVSTPAAKVDNNYCADLDAAGLWQEEEEPVICKFKPAEMGVYYNKGKKQIDAIQKELGCDIICNLNLFNGDWTGACYTRMDGKIIGSDGYNYYGFGFDKNDGTLTRGWSDRDRHSNFFGCFDVVSGGVETTEKLPEWTNGLRRRTVIGTLADGTVFIYANPTAETPQRMLQNLYGMGAAEAICLDGGGSTQLISPVGKVVSSDAKPRPVHTLFWANLTEHKKVCPYKEPTGIIKFGTIGDNARWAQWMLVQAGYDIGSGGQNKDGIDGIFGMKCRNATIELQKKVGFTGKDVDGQIGPKTKPMMKKEAGL